MLCRKPYMLGKAALPCGQCDPCRIQRRRVWAMRIMLEASVHKSNGFLTLTYKDAPPELVPRDLTLFLKRLRKLHPFRFFACGEYGDRTYRPHYHVALFGYPRCRVGLTVNAGDGGPLCCSICRAIAQEWGIGRIQLGNLEPASAAYIAGYVTKKMTGHQAPFGLVPEFTRMSSRPAIGTYSMFPVARAIQESQQDDLADDVPAALKVGGYIRPFGRTLRNKLRKALDRYEGAPPKALKALEEGMSEVRSLAFENSLSLPQVLSSLDDGRALDMVASVKLKGRLL